MTLIPTLIALLLVQAPAAPSALRVADEEFFETWAPRAHRAYALDSDAAVEALAGVSNTHVRYDAALDAAVMTTPAGASGIPLVDELRLPVDIPEPTGSAVWWVIFDVWLGPELEAAYRQHIGNGGTKFWHLRGADGDESDYRDGIVKLALNVRTGPNCQTPCMGRMSTQMAWEHLGANATGNEPVAPSSWGDLHSGIWNRLWIRMAERAPVGEPVSTLSVWMADEVRDPVRVHDEIQIRMPWSDSVGAGFRHIHVLQSWKDAMPWAVRVALRQVLVLEYAGPVGAVLVRPEG